MAQYIAYPYGKMNQSFAMRNEENQMVFEANLVKFKLFGACDYEFVNKVLGGTTPHKVGKTITHEQSFGGIGATTQSTFKLDGVDVFELLDKKGCQISFVAKIDLMHPEFALVNKEGATIATYKMNVLGDRQEGVGAIGNKQRNTVITTECDDLELVFLGAFILHRVDFSTELL